MSKKDAKVSEAQLPTPPLVTKFIHTLKEWKDKKQAAPARSNMFEDESDHEQHVGKPINTKRTEAVAVNVAMHCLESTMHCANSTNLCLPPR